MEKLLLTAEEAGQLLGISRSKVYGLMGNAEIESVVIGKSRRILRDELNRYVERLRDESSAA